jgi:hypothetical protein
LTAHGKQLIQTNPTKDSVCSVSTQPITFKRLWDSYVTGDPYRDPKTGEVPPGYADQCAIRMSATLHKAGVQMKSFNMANVKLAAGESFGRILLDGLPTATKASQLGSWLSKQPFCGLPPIPEDITGQDWEAKVKGRTGIVMFDRYWTRQGETSPSGGHIDLWNGKRLTISGAIDGIAVAGRYIGVNSFLPGTNFGFSDLRNSKVILFWQIK